MPDNLKRSQISETRPKKDQPGKLACHKALSWGSFDSFAHAKV